MGFIYKITNDVNGKMYVGKTELPDPNERWKQHLNDFKRERCEKRPLYAAMNKYGTDHFHFEVIEETDNTEERERYWIEELRTYVGFKDYNGYNATLGGDGKSYLELDEDEVIKYHTEEAGYVAGITAKYFNVDPNTIKKILKKNKIVWLRNNDNFILRQYLKYGGVFQIDKKSKLIIAAFINTVEAARNLNKNNYTIAEACSKKSHYAYGYLWYYGKDLNKAMENGEINKVSTWF